MGIVLTGAAYGSAAGIVAGGVQGGAMTEGAIIGGVMGGALGGMAGITEQVFNKTNPSQEDGMPRKEKPWTESK